MLEKIDIQEVIAIAKQAGDEIMTIYNSTDFWVEFKDDDSPLTKADIASNTVIVSSLKKLYPEIPMLSEEEAEVPYEERQNWEYFWSIDPLDGTKEFVKRNGDFTVNIALIHRDTPVAGVIYAPVHDEVYYATAWQWAYKLQSDDTIVQLQEKTEFSADTLRVVASRSHKWELLEGYLEDIKTEKNLEIDYVSVGSSLKFCIIADGRADIYPRFVPTMEWDTAAGQAILEELGYSILVYPEWIPLRYNRENLRNPFFIAD